MSLKFIEKQNYKADMGGRNSEIGRKACDKEIS